MPKVTQQYQSWKVQQQAEHEANIRKYGQCGVKKDFYNPYDNPVQVMSFYEYCENGGSSDGCDLFVGDFS